MITKNIIIYIHGISPDPNPSDHKKYYNVFEKGLKKSFSAQNLEYPSTRIDIEWGHNFTGINTDDQHLAKVQKKLLENINEKSKQHPDLTINPLRLVHYMIRENFILGFSDIFYYISEDGKAAVRKNVNNLPTLKDNESYSFTIIAHSAGTVIMHDLLFIIFGGKSKPYLDDDNVKQKLASIQAYAKNGKFHIKTFITLGSPITPLIIRSKDLMEKINSDQKIDSTEIGIKSGSLWLNFWDKDDVISYPLDFLYQTQGLIKDQYIDLGDVFPTCHNNYWGNQEIHKTIAY